MSSARSRRSFRLVAGAVLAGLPLLGGCILGSPSASSSASAAPASSQSVASSPSPAASIAGTPEASPAASGTAGPLAEGVYAMVVADGLYVHVSATTTSTRVGQLFYSDVVQILAKAGTEGGYTWYQVQAFQTVNDQPLIGYVAGAKGKTAYLKALPGKPSPTPSRSPTLSPAPSATASS
jgi:hypothetical protein